MEKNAQVVLFRIFFFETSTTKKNSIRNFLIEKRRKKTKNKKVKFRTFKNFFVCTLLVRQKKILFFILF